MNFFILQVGDWGLGVFGAIWGQNKKKSNLDRFYTLMKLLLPLEKSFPRSVKPQSGGIWAHLGSKSKDFIQKSRRSLQKSSDRNRQSPS